MNVFIAGKALNEASKISFFLVDPSFSMPKRRIFLYNESFSIALLARNCLKLKNFEMVFSQLLKSFKSHLKELEYDILLDPFQ